MARVTLKIPIRRKVARYLQVHLKNTNNVIYLDSKSALGGWLMGMVETASKPAKLGPSDCFVEVKVPDRDQRGGNYDSRCTFLSISQVNIDRFNELIEWLMKKELYDRLALIEERGENHQRNGKQRHEIEKFIKKYGDDQEELNVDSLSRGYRRYKKNGKVLMDQLV